MGKKNYRKKGGKKGFEYIKILSLQAPGGWVEAIDKRIHSQCGCCRRKKKEGKTFGVEGDGRASSKRKKRKIFLGGKGSLSLAKRGKGGHLCHARENGQPRPAASYRSRGRGRTNVDQLYLKKEEGKEILPRKGGLEDEGEGKVGP